jgi:hypothetical protein
LVKILMLFSNAILASSYGSIFKTPETAYKTYIILQG